MRTINDNIPESLTSAASRLMEAGFQCKPYCVESYGVGMTKLITKGLTVTIKSGHPNFVWDTYSVSTTPYVAQIHGQKVKIASPRGFQYLERNDEFALSSQLDSDEEIEEFIACFTIPKGPDNKIIGPRSIPSTRPRMKP